MCVNRKRKKEVNVDNYYNEIAERCDRCDKQSDNDDVE